MKPKLCILDTNTLAAIGLKHLLQQVMPIVQVDCFGSVTELKANNPEEYAHYFVAMSIVLEHRSFFSPQSRKTIVLTTAIEASKQLGEFHCLYLNVPEHVLVRSLLFLQQHAHGQHGKHPIDSGWSNSELLSAREVEVMTLIVKGLINKEIAERLNIALSTVITHRKNIMAKLGIRSVSALTVHAVMKGYVDIDMI